MPWATSSLLPCPLPGAVGAGEVPLALRGPGMPWQWGTFVREQQGFTAA